MPDHHSVDLSALCRIKPLNISRDRASVFSSRRLVSLINPTVGVPLTLTQHCGLTSGFKIIPCHSSRAGVVRRGRSAGALGKAVAMSRSSQTRKQPLCFIQQCNFTVFFSAQPLLVRQLFPVCSGHALLWPVLRSTRDPQPAQPRADAAGVKREQRTR